MKPMSHLVTIQCRIRDAAVVATTCRRLGLAEPVHGTARLYSAEVTGLLLHLPDWQYPAVIDTSTGTIAYDNFGGIWGDERDLHRFLQIYAVEMAKSEARRRGYAVSEQAMQDGAIKLQIIEQG
jgi:hypothetical protein